MGLIAAADLTPEKIAEIADLYTKKAGNVGATCRAIEISRVTFYEWKKTIPEFGRAISEAQDGLIDHAESKLYQNILDGKEVSLIFYLKNKRPNEWRDRKEIDLTGVKLIEVDK